MFGCLFIFFIGATSHLPLSHAAGAARGGVGLFCFVYGFTSDIGPWLFAFTPLSGRSSDVSTVLLSPDRLGVHLGWARVLREALFKPSHLE